MSNGNKTDEALLSSFINAAVHSLAWHLEAVEGVPNPQARAQEIRARLADAASRGDSGKAK